MAGWSSFLQGLVVATCVAQCSSWSLMPSGIHSGRASGLQLRNSAQACARASVCMSSSQPLEQGQLSRQEFVRGVAAVVFPLAIGATSPLPAFAGDDTLKKIEEIPLTVVQTIAGGSVKEFDEMKETFKPAKDLQGVELALYKLYRYAAVKTPATEDPRLSLRPLFFSKSGDALFQLVTESAKLKVYDARGDGLTNQGKGGVLKGTRILLETLKSKGVISDFSVDSSAHNDLSWAQANPSSVTVTVKAPIGAAANKQLEEEKVGLTLSLAAQALAGYYKQCKIATTPEITTTADGETIKLNMAWAGKARQKNTMDRRNADKLNAARGYKE